MLGFGVMIVNAYILYKTAHIIIWRNKKDKVLSQYERGNEISLIWIKKNMANVEVNHENNKRGRDNVTRSLAGSSI